MPKERDEKGRWVPTGPQPLEKVVRVSKDELKALQEAREKQVPLSKVISKDDKK